MKISSLLVAALTAAGAWAEASKPLGFFIKVGEEYVPLRYDESTSEFRHAPNSKPSSVMLSQTSKERFYAKTSSGVVGIKGSVLAHGPDLKEEVFSIDKHLKRVFLELYFCQRSGSIVRSSISGDACSPVELYLSPFDEKTGSISLDQNVSAEPVLYVPADNIPHTLFAEDPAFGGEHPVYTSSDGTMFFVSHDVFQPERFFYENGFLFTKDPSKRYLGLDNNMLAHTSSSSPFSFTFLQDYPAVEDVFFACSTFDPNIHFISLEKSNDCSAITLSYSPYQKDGEKAPADSALPEAEVYMPNTQENPLAFFAKLANTYHPLSSFSLYEGANILSYGTPFPPIEIRLENRYAVPINTIYTEPVTLVAGRLAFGPFGGDQKLELDLDEDGMLKGKTFFSCGDRVGKYFAIVESQRPDPTCSSVDIYVGRLKRQTGEYIKFNPHRPERDDNNGSDKSGKGGTPKPVDDPLSNPSKGKVPNPEEKDQDEHENQNPSGGTQTSKDVSPGDKKGQDVNPEAPKVDNESEKGNEPTDNGDKGEEPKGKDEPKKGQVPTDGGDNAQEPKEKDEPERGHVPTDGDDKVQEPRKNDEPSEGHEPKQKNPDDGHTPPANGGKAQEPKGKDEPERGHVPTDGDDKAQEPKTNDEPNEGHEPKHKNSGEGNAPTDSGDKGQEPKGKDEPERGHVPAEGEDKEPGQKSPVPGKDDAQVRESPEPKPGHKAELGAHSEDVPATDGRPNVPGVPSDSGSRPSNSKIDDTIHGASDVSSTSKGSNVTSSDSTMHRMYNSTHISVSNTSEYRFHDIFRSTNRSHVTNIRGGDCPECGDMNNADASGQHARPIREAASPTTICDECHATTKTVWNTCTDYTTYCPQKTTLTISKCEEVCSKTRVTVTAPTMFTCPGVCIIPETVAEVVTHSGVKTATAVNIAVETGDTRGVINAPKSVSPHSPKEGRKSFESTNEKESSKASSEKGINSEQEIRTKEKEVGSKNLEISSDENEVGSKKHGISSNEKEVASQKHEISSDETKVGSNEKENRKGKERGPEKRPSVGSSDKGNAPKEQSSDVPKPKAARLTGDSARSSKTRPVDDETSTSTLTSTVTKPDVTPYDNGASRMPVGAFLFVLASLLM